MNLDDLKRRAVESAVKLMANDTVREAVDSALGAGQAVADEFRTLRDEVRRQMDAGRPVDDDTAALKERLDRLRESGDGTDTP